MTRRTTRAAVASLGVTTLLVASLGAGTFAQSPSAAAPVGEEPPAPTTDITSYPNYGGGVDCEAGTFNGSPYSGNLKSIDAPDASTVVFTFCNPNVAFLAQIAFSALGIDDGQYLIDHAADGALLNQPNGTGPYKFVSWDLGSRIDLTANDAYWGDKALTPNLEFQWNADSAARFLALSGGTVDGIDNPGKDDMPAIESDANLKLYPREGLNTFYLGMNTPSSRSRTCGSARPSPWASTASASSTTSTRPAPRSPPTSPRARFPSHAVARIRGPSMPRPPRPCSPRPGTPMASRPRSSSGTRLAATCPTRRPSPRRSPRSSRRTWASP